jgi:hypothetical protein
MKPDISSIDLDEKAPLSVRFVTRVLFLFVQLTMIDLALIYVLPKIGGVAVHADPVSTLGIAVLLSVVNIVVFFLAALWFTLAYTAVMLATKDWSDPSAWNEGYRKTFAKYSKPFRRSRILSWLAVAWPLTSLAMKALSDMRPDLLEIEGWVPAFCSGLIVSGIDQLTNARWFVAQLRKEDPYADLDDAQGMHND